MNFLSKIWASLTGINLLPGAGDPASPSDGDIWYNNTIGKFRKMQGGAVSDLDEPIVIGAPITSGTNGSVLFIDGGNLAQDNPNLFWDKSNNSLNIGTHSRHSYIQLDVKGGFSAGTNNEFFFDDATKTLYLSGGGTSGSSFQIYKANTGISEFLKMADGATGGYISLGSAGSSFTPAIQASAGTSVNQTLYITQITNDSTSSAAIRFDGRNPGSKLSTQPVVEFGSYTDTYVKIMADGTARFSKLETGSTSPSPTGTTKMVITDANGQLAFQNIPSGLAIGASITSATAKSVLYSGASGVLAQDNTNFKYDYSGKVLSIGKGLNVGASNASFYYESVLFGYLNSALGKYTLVGGDSSYVGGNSSIAYGVGVSALSYGEAAFGTFNPHCSYPSATSCK